MTYTPKAYLTYALNSDGDLVHIDSVPNGNNCGCFCPHCKEELCARNNGEKRTHHFAHTSGADCAGAIESALHVMAKKVLQEIKCLQLPNVQKKYIMSTRFGDLDCIYEEQGDLLMFDKIDVECTDIETNLRPDCIGYYGDKKIWIEFKRTHAVDEEKKAKIIAAQIDCIEIDINSCELDYDAVRKFIKDNKTCREWINNTRNKETQIIRISDRNYIKDENGNIVNIRENKIDIDKHSYYCLACGKELFFEKINQQDYYGRHLDDDICCNNEQYLKNAAKEILLNKFNSSEIFEISIPYRIHYKCKLAKQCEFYNNKCTSEGEGRKKYDIIGDWNYNECFKDYKFSDDEHIYDFVIKRLNKTDDSIAININDNYDREANSTNKYRMINIKISNENVLETLQNCAIGKSSFGVEYDFYNFRIKNEENYNSPQKRNIHRFSLLRNGEYKFDSLACTEIKKKDPNSIVEYLFVDINNYLIAKPYSLLRCYAQGRKTSYCAICAYKKMSDDIYKYQKEKHVLSKTNH